MLPLLALFVSKGFIVHREHEVKQEQWKANEEETKVPPPRVQSHQMLPAQWGNKLVMLSLDAPRCFSKNHMEQFLQVLSNSKNKHVLHLSVRYQLNSKIIVESHTEHSVQGSSVLGEWTKIFTLADQMKKQKWNPSFFIL